MKSQETPPKTPRPEPKARKTRGGQSSSPEEEAEKNDAEKEKQAPHPPAGIKLSPSKKADQVPPKEQETAKEMTLKQSRHDDTDTSDSDEDDDRKGKEETKTLSSTSKKVLEPKSKPHTSPSPKRSSKPSDISFSGDEDHNHEDVGVEPDTETQTYSGKPTKIKDEDLTEGMNIFSLMDSKEIEELLCRIDKQCSPTDNFAVRKRENAIDWDEVAFSSYGGKQCRAVWIYLKHHTRTYRIMSEVVNEVKYRFLSDKTFQTKLIESLPGFPQKPPNSLGGFYCFNREQWEKKKDAAAQLEQNTPNFVKV